MVNCASRDQARLGVGITLAAVLSRAEFPPRAVPVRHRAHDELAVLAGIAGEWPRDGHPPAPDHARLRGLLRCARGVPPGAVHPLDKPRVPIAVSDAPGLEIDTERERSTCVHAASMPDALTLKRSASCRHPADRLNTGQGGAERRPHRAQLWGARPVYAGPQSYVIQIRSASYVTRAVHCEQPSSSPTSIQFGGAASMAASCKRLALVPVRSFSGNNTTWGSRQQRRQQHHHPPGQLGLLRQE